MYSSKDNSGYNIYVKSSPFKASVLNRSQVVSFVVYSELLFDERNAEIQNLINHL